MKGKIVLVPFPFDDLSGAKPRPALCLAGPIGVYNHVVLAYVTSRVLASPLESDVVLNDTVQDFALTGLKVSSTLRLHQLATVRASLVIRQLGELPADLASEVETKVKQLFES